MATKKNPVKVTDTRTMETKEFANAEMALSYLEDPTIMPKLDVGGSSNYAKKIADKIIESTNTAGSAMENVAPTSIDYRKNGDSKTTFKNGGEREAAAGNTTLDEVASEYAEDKFTPTGIWEYDLGYALGRSRKKKIDAAGGEEAFKAAKRQKRNETAMKAVDKLQSTFGIGSYGKDKKPIKQNKLQHLTNVDRDHQQSKYKSVRQAVKDVRKNPLQSHYIADKFGGERKYGGRSASNK